MRIGTIITALLALLAPVMPVPACAGRAFALPPVPCTIIIILVIVVIYLWWTPRSASRAVMRDGSSGIPATRRPA
jgi:hypothetical protein